MSEEHEEARLPILVPVDFSPYSVAALVWAAHLSTKLDHPLRVLHVAQDPPSSPGYYAKAQNKEPLMRIEEAATQMMRDFLSEVAAEHPEIEELQRIDSMVVVGLPVTRILEVAQKINAKMIVMGSQGRTGLPHLLLGSKAERIVQLSPIPVTIVKAKTEKLAKH